MHFRLLAVLFCVVPLRAADNVLPDGLFCGPFGPGGTWNIYQTSAAPLTWVKAQELAAATKDPRGGTDKMGHLVAIGSAAENMFVRQYAAGSFLWIGLTDNEKFGGREAANDRSGGWRWVSGEPPGDFAPWCGSEPSSGPGFPEDAVAMTTAGLWVDWGIGTGGEAEITQSFVIEWDTQLPEPVAGVRTIGRVLPERWPADLLAGTSVRDGTGPWTTCSLTGLDSHSIRAMLDTFLPRLKADIPRYDMPRINYYLAWRNESPAAGWIALSDSPPHPCEDNTGALHVATVRVATAGVWSFNIHGDDFFAARFPGMKWMGATGIGGLDPLDAETLFFDTGKGDGYAIGVIELPAGDHRMEVFLGNRGGRMTLQVLAAPGAFTCDGATSAWRVPGHKAAGEIAWPGISAAGWTVTRTLVPGYGKPLYTLRNAFNLVDTVDGFTVQGVDFINHTDSGAVSDIEFPDPVSFPGDAPGGQNNFAILATATLVIPRDGDYHVGIHSEDHSALCIGGQQWTAHLRSTGGAGHMKDGTLWEDEPISYGCNAQNVGAITLKKGEYPIEVLYADTTGPSILSVFASPAGYPPRLLTKGGAKLEPDTDGLPLVEGR
jgi:hypothetical protein